MKMKFQTFQYCWTDQLFRTAPLHGAALPLLISLLTLRSLPLIWLSKTAQSDKSTWCRLKIESRLQGDGPAQPAPFPEDFSGGKAHTMLH